MATTHHLRSVIRADEGGDIDPIPVVMDGLSITSNKNSASFLPPVADGSTRVT